MRAYLFEYFTCALYSLAISTCMHGEQRQEEASQVGIYGRRHPHVTDMELRIPTGCCAVCTTHLQQTNKVRSTYFLCKNQQLHACVHAMSAERHGKGEVTNQLIHACMHACKTPTDVRTLRRSFVRTVAVACMPRPFDLFSSRVLLIVRDYTYLHIQIIS